MTLINFQSPLSIIIYIQKPQPQTLPFRMDNELTCSLCEQQYTDQNPPRLLITCGHTFCQKCVKKIITQKKGSYKLVCPQDGEMITLKDSSIGNFPKNIALMKILESKKNSSSMEFKDPYLEMSKIVKSEEQQEDQDTRDLVASIISPNNTKSQDAIKLENKEQGQKQEKQKEKTSKTSSPDRQKKQQREMCLLHQKPLQVVCVIDLKKICASCAIFGEHKGHDFKSIEEIEKQRVEYYHAILNIMEKKENITERLSNEQTCTSIMDILGKKKETMKKNISEKYQKLLAAIQTKQKQSMKSLQTVILKTESKLKNLMKIDSTTLQKYDKWQQKSYRQIKILEGEDFQSKLQLLFVGATANQTDVLEQGDIIIERMYKQEENLINQVQLALENIGVDFNMEIFNHIEGFVQLYDQAKKKKSKGRANKLQSLPNTTANTSLTGNKPASQPTKKPEEPPNLRTPQQKPKHQSPQTIKTQTENQNQNQNQNQSQNLNINSIPHHEESLLQMEDPHQEPAQLPVPRKNNQDILSYSMKQTPEKSQLVSGLDLSLSDRKLEKQEELSETVLSKKQKEQVSISQKKSPQLTQRSNQKDNSFTQQKIDRPNKKKILSKIKLSQKYMKILDSLANDQLETVDFTNAQMGDSNAILICQFLNGSKAKTVKLISNKLSDETIQKIIPFMSGVITLNISQNFLTERALDIIYNLKDHLTSIKSIILCQNKIIERKHKAKIDKLKDLGINISV